jgi:hypothetical protein
MCSILKGQLNLSKSRQNFQVDILAHPPAKRKPTQQTLSSNCYPERSEGTVKNPYLRLLHFARHDDVARSGIHPEGFSSGDSSGDITGTITRTTLKGMGTALKSL